MAENSFMLRERVETALRVFHMIPDQRPVLVAVSGGPDSVCLLDVLHALSIPVEIAHFDHQTRNGASGEDAAFVRTRAETVGVPFHLGSQPIAKEAKQQGRSFEEYAREARYTFLHRIAQERNCSAIATGHTADDQAETVIMRLIRGTAVRGAAGIPPVGVWHGTEGSTPVRLIRPLIGCQRADVLAYAAARGLVYQTDASNMDPQYARNRIRHELLPFLAERFNPEVRETLARFAETARADTSLLDQLAVTASQRCLCGHDAHTIDRALFAELHIALQRRVVDKLFRRLSVEPSFERIDAGVTFIVSGAAGHRFDMGEGVLLENGRCQTVVVRKESRRPVSAAAMLHVPGVTHMFGRIFTTRFLNTLPQEPLAQYCGPTRQVFDAQTLVSPVYVRMRQPGDRIAPLGMTGTKSLGNYFTDKGVPVSWRDRIPLVTAANGEIVWITGYAVSKYTAVTTATKQWLEIEVSEDDEDDQTAVDRGK